MDNYQLFSLLIQGAFFLIGVYLYLFARGFIRFGSEEVKARSEAFRQENKGWMRLLGLALAAIMLMNIVLGLMGR